MKIMDYKLAKYFGKQFKDVRGMLLIRTEQATRETLRVYLTDTSTVLNSGSGYLVELQKYVHRKGPIFHICYTKNKNLTETDMGFVIQPNVNQEWRELVFDEQ